MGNRIGSKSRSTQFGRGSLGNCHSALITVAVYRGGEEVFALHGTFIAELYHDWANKAMKRLKSVRELDETFVGFPNV